MVILFVQHSGMTIVCMYCRMCMQSLLQPPFCVCHSCKEEKEQVKEKKEEGGKEQKWWVC